jgi:hypothetical protein
LIAGGLEVGPLVGMDGGMTTLTASVPLSVILPDPVLRARGIPVPVDSAMWPTPILHAALALEDGSVMIAGGSLRAMVGLSSQQLFATASVLRVSGDAAGGFTAAPLARMIAPRWGHAIARLPGNRVLVTGGFFRNDDDELRALSGGETILLEPPPAGIGPCMDVPRTDGGRADAGTRVDAGAIEDSGAVGVDAPP